ncbi:hypothetical protein I1A62_03965 (plasmid) [Rhodococcus sp. USK10]|uniref:hypothetical protein n=1 Tax=Rhodococcus sp. USK10 TaxID=2789739 RepID=UPI001C5FCEDE|nr:hypothetical protein [Rhodococcus sp. USK10]QYB00231.1 hypothetical protein I1A62_03965 [Rhodococcus sp. USK10]
MRSIHLFDHDHDHDHEYEYEYEYEYGSMVLYTSPSTKEQCHSARDNNSSNVMISGS